MWRLLILLCIFAASFDRAMAAWYATESRTSLAIVGYGTNNEGFSGFIKLTCSASSVFISLETSNIAMLDADVESYRDAHMVLTYQDDRGGHHIVLRAEPKRSVSNMLVLHASLTEEQAQPVFKSIIKGHRLMVAGVAGALPPEQNALTVYSQGYTGVIFSLDKMCPRFIRAPK